MRRPMKQGSSFQGAQKLNKLPRDETGSTLIGCPSRSCPSFTVGPLTAVSRSTSTGVLQAIAKVRRASISPAERTTISFLSKLIPSPFSKKKIEELTGKRENIWLRMISTKASFGKLVSVETLPPPPQKKKKEQTFALQELSDHWIPKKSKTIKFCSFNPNQFCSFHWASENFWDGHPKLSCINFQIFQKV